MRVFQLHLVITQIRRIRTAQAISSQSNTFEEYILQLQSDIIAQSQQLDGSGATFCTDSWTRPNGGFGITSVLEGGDIVEKAAANISVIQGILSPTRAQAMSERGRDINPNGGQPYSAQAMSLVFHSAHPMIPTLRADVRRFEVEGHAWFGGGCDLTPFYVFEEDFSEFHQHWKDVCDAHDQGLYTEYKSWCDKYFYIPCRKEHRGVGGLFFDDVDEGNDSFNVEQVSTMYDVVLV